MILYPRQVVYVHLLASNIGRADICADKSREMGITWCALYELMRWWLFQKGTKILLASWKERYVWNPGDMDALFQKLDFILKYLPGWMKPVVKARRDQKQLRLLNPRNAAAFTGEATVENLGRAGRQTAILLDEAGYMPGLAAILESTTDTCDCRIMQSTPSFASHEFSAQRRKCQLRFRFWWPDHPVKAQGLYGAGLTEKPASGWWSDNVEGLRGKLRSPWYDMRCKRARNEGEVAREIDIDDSGTGYRFFPEELLRDLTDVKRYCMPPLHEGELVQGAFVEANTLGALKLWFHPTNGRPPLDRRYAAGCDVAMGTRDESGRGQSNSSAQFGDAKTGEVLAEYTVHGVPPDEFARVVVEICEWFSGSEQVFLGWEDNGPGEFFAKVVMEDAGWGCVYYRQQEAKAGKPQTAQPGWWSTRQTKYALFCELLQAIKDEHLIVRNLETIKEMRCYQAGVGSRAVYHVDAEATADPTQAKENHGDRVVALAVLWRCLRQIGYKGAMDLPEDQVSEYDRYSSPVGSVAWGRDHRAEGDQEKELASF